MSTIIVVELIVIYLITCVTVSLHGMHAIVIVVITLYILLHFDNRVQ
jgi:hypothetical protein